MTVTVRRLRTALETAPELTDAEERIGTILLSNPREAPLLTAAQLAERAGVHESTVIRFAQKLGYSGYLALRSDLAKDSMHRDTLTMRVQERGDHLSFDYVIQAQIESLSRLREHIAQESIDAAAATIAGATRVHVFGRGLLAPLAEFFERKMLLLGLSVALVRESGQELVERMAAVQPDDVVVFFVFSEHYAELNPFVEPLATHGSKIVLITDESTARMLPAPEAVLAIPRAEIRFGLFVPFIAVCYALEFTVTLQNPERVRLTRERVTYLGARTAGGQPGGPALP